MGLRGGEGECRWVGERQRAREGEKEGDVIYLNVFTNVIMYSFADMKPVAVFDARIYI